MDDDTPELGKYLFSLLESCERYRRQWERMATGHRHPGGSHSGASHSGVSHAAVARVIAEHLVDAGERSVFDDGVGRSLKDRVGRAAEGRLSGETLRWFIAAFGMDEAHAATLWHLFSSWEASEGTPPARPRPAGGDGLSTTP